jgi:hypothetical protein
MTANLQKLDSEPFPAHYDGETALCIVSSLVAKNISFHKMFLRSNVPPTTLRRIYRELDRPIKPATLNSVRDMQRSEIENVWCSPVTEIGDLTEDSVFKFSAGEYSKQLQALECAAEFTSEQHKDDLHAVADAYLCRGRLLQLRAYAMRVKKDELVKWRAEREKLLALAVEYYDAGLQKLENIRGRVAEIIRGKLHSNRFGVLFNKQDKATRVRDKQLIRQLRESGFLAAADRMMDYEPYNWRFARNGLLVASIMEDINECKKFWGHLYKIDKNFHEKPKGELPSLLSDSDFEFFKKNIDTIKGE